MSSQRTLFAALIFIAICVISSKAKVVSGSAKLTGVNTEHVVTKFAVSPHGKGKVSVTLTTDTMYEDERHLKMYFFSDDVWPKVTHATTCAEKVRLANQASVISFRSTRGDRPDGRRDTWIAKINSILMKFDDRPRYWYILIADCSYEMYYHDKSNGPINYRLEVMDNYIDITRPEHEPEYSHIPYDERGMIKFHTVNLVFSFLIALFLLQTVLSQKNGNGEVHLSSIIIGLTCLIWSSSSVCEVIHLNAYKRNGIGSHFFDALSAHFEAVCDSLISLLLLAIAVGWTLPSDISVQAKNINNSSILVSACNGLRNPSVAIQKGNPAGILSIAMFLVHAIIAQWGRIYDDDFDCYHDLEHLPGKILFCLRFILGIAFLVGVASLKRSTHCSHELSKFLTTFSVTGFVWFLCAPSMCVFISLVAPVYRRHQLVSICSGVYQLAALSSLALFVTADSSKSAFHKVSKIGGGDDGLSSLSNGSSMQNSGNASKSIFRIGKSKVRLD